MIFFLVFTAAVNSSLCRGCRSALIKHGVALVWNPPAEPRRKVLIPTLRMELWHTMALPSSLPPTDSQLKAFSSGGFLIGLPSSGTHKHTCIYETHKPLAAHACLHLCACSSLMPFKFKTLWAFWSALRPDGSLLTFHIMQRRGR